ncbi:MAG: PH domain-containing protein, partial [Methylacidiphilales bacterium]|nr:PH domain-containing protein [Candidatus Methylacidiphilales bacterium]
MGGPPDPWSVVRDRGFMVPLWIAAISVPLGAVLALAGGSGLAYYLGLGLLVGAVVIGLLTFGFWRRAVETVYGLTDQRVLVLYDGAIPRLNTTHTDRIAWIDVVRQRDGTGAVTFTIADGSSSGTELVLGGLTDPRDVARRAVQAF